MLPETRSPLNRRSSLLRALGTGLVALALAGCGSGDAPSFPLKSVRYEGQGLLVDGVAYLRSDADFIQSPGRVYVFSTNQPADQDEVSRFVASFGLQTGDFAGKGRQPPFTSTVAPVAVPVGFESQWAQALRHTPPGVSALTLDPCC